MKVQFEELVQLKQLLEITKNNCIMAQNLPFDSKYFVDYINMESIFLKNGREYYSNEELTPQELGQYYEKEYETYHSQMQMMH